MRGEVRRRGSSLRPAGLVEGDVGVPLGALGKVPGGLPVADQDETSGHRVWEATSAGSSMDGQSRHSRSRA